MNVTKSFSVDLQNKTFPVVIDMKQYDANTRILQMTLLNNGSVFTMPPSPTFLCGCRLPDGNTVLYDSVINAVPTLGLSVSVDAAVWESTGLTSAIFTYTSGAWKLNGNTVNLANYGITITNGTPSNNNTIAVSSGVSVTNASNVCTVKIAPSCLMAAGKARFDLIVLNGSERIGTFSCILNIEAAAVDETALTPQSFVMLSAQVESYVNAWLTAHPEATTTVQDGSITMSKFSQTVLDFFDTKANIDGSYADLTAGNADQLVSTVGIEDKVPYNFRTSGGSVDIGNRETDMIVGGTLAWNQIGENGDFSNGTSKWSAVRGNISVSGNVLTIIATANDPAAYHQCLPVYAGNKILVLTTLESNNSTSQGLIQIRNSTSMISLKSGVSISANVKQEISAILASNVDTDFTVAAVYPSPENASTIKIYSQSVHNLSLIFGTVIADYIYSIEQTTPGAGVALFKKLFPEPFYAYNAGEIMSVKTSAHNMVGFNAYNNATGKAKLVGGMQYQITGEYTSLSYSTGEAITPEENGKFTPSNNGELTVTGGNATNTCVHLVWSGYRDGEFEPYLMNSYPFDDTLTLCGVPKLDAENKMYYDGDTYESTGTVTRKYGKRSTDTITINNMANPSIQNNLTIIWLNLGSTKGYADNSCICARIPRLRYAEYLNDSSGIGSGSPENPTNVWIKMPTSVIGSTKQEVYDYLHNNPFDIYFPLATPTTETADPYTNPQIVNDFGTEEYVDSRTVPIPVGHNTLYQVNLRDKLQNAPDSPSNNGDYVLRRSNSGNEYVPLVIPSELPTVPGTDGAYTLKVTVNNGTATLSWV